MIIGRIKDFTNDIFTRKQNLLLEIDGDCSELIDRLKNDDISIELKKYIPKRSLTANGYYWSLVHKISVINNVSDTFTHNKYLRQCRCLMTIGGKTVAVTIPDTIEAESSVLERSDVHLIPTSKTERGLRYYLMLKGSSEFDAKEMSRLIDFAVEDARQMGIETITEQEKERLVQLYG